jgi:hemerythrin-like domain-containing protein
MESKGIPREGGPIGVMLLEHQQGRQRVRAMADDLESADGGDAVSMERVLDQGQAFLELLRGHINKEDNILFNMADHATSPTV